MSLESRHNNARLCLWKEQDESALGSPVSSRNSVENTAELGQEYMCLFAPSGAASLCIESSLL